MFNTGAKKPNSPNAENFKFVVQWEDGAEDMEKSGYVGFLANGDIEFGGGYDPAPAARVFWNCVSKAIASSPPPEAAGPPPPGSGDMRRVDYGPLIIARDQAALLALNAAIPVEHRMEFRGQHNGLEMALAVLQGRGANPIPPDAWEAGKKE